MHDELGMGQSVDHWCQGSAGLSDVTLVFSDIKSSGTVAALPLHVVHVACHTKASESVNLSIVD